ncbi:polyamine ABC transporter substrate-binding protein [Rhodobacter sp. Har01]|uniref:polyamine ABC transporter substrate-binding protein n=1 Tax=Rhodobacter sp. Har01 TaxID=2883999 RepID=UPI001D096DA4|nr:polyamine ABC transporter substrate-binding protein [Rhodobacter sp. Har01]MCB6178547.1 polyamine ABC transporter substrate-binding protein [Rhodobacter sp. Har01]
MRITRRSTLAALTGGLAMPYVRPSWAQGGTVNVYNWSDYIGETTVADFTAETGIEVVYDLYASSEEAQAKMLAGSTGYDVVLHAGMSLGRFVQAGVFQKLDLARLTGWGNLDPDILKVIEGFDPGHQYGVPYMWGSVGMTYNLAMVKERLPDADLESLDTIMNPENAAKLADCGLSILDSPTDAGFMVMKYLGLDPNTAGEAEYRKLAEAMAAIRPYIATFDNSNYLTALPNQEVCAVNNWSGDYGVAKARAAEAGIDIDLAYYVPKTGAPAWFDLWCIPSDAPNLENAYLFIDYLLRPEVAAACTDFTGYANANKAATAFVDPAIASDPAVYPDATVMARLYTPTPQTDEQEEAMTRVWTEIKTGG